MDLNTWKKEAIKYQDAFSAMLEDRIWDEFKFTEKCHIYFKIAPALFGLPLADDKYLGFSKQQVNLAEDIIDKMNKYSFCKDKIHMAVIFVCVYSNKTSMSVPLIRVRSTECTTKSEIPNNVFIDHLGRIYDNWTAYLEKNTWKLSWLCVPVNGYYSSEQDYIFINQEEQGLFLTVLDKMSLATNLGSSIGMVTGVAMTFFPPTAIAGGMVMVASTVIGVPGMVFGVGRSIQTLYGRTKHDQSIGLNNSEARQCWLATSGGILTISTFGFLKFITESAKAGKALSGVSNVVFSGLQVSSLSVNGLGVINYLYDLKKQREISTLEILQVTTSLLLFTHSLFSIRSMNSIVNDAQNKTILDIQNNIGKRDQIKLKALLQDKIETHGSVIQGQQEFIRAFQNVDNLPAFLSNFVMSDGQLSVSQSVSTVSKSFCSLSKSTKIELLSLLEKLKHNEISQSQLIKKAPTVVKQFLQNRHNNQDNKIKDVNTNECGTDKLTIGGKRVDQLNSTEKSNFVKISEACDKRMLPIIKSVVQQFNFETMQHYCIVLKKSFDYIKNEIVERRITNSSPSRSYGVSVTEHYTNQIKNEILGVEKGESFIEKKLKEIYDQSKEECFEFEGFIPELNNLSYEKYCNIVDEMVGYEVAIKNWYQKVDSLECLFVSKLNNLECVFFVNIDTTSVLAVYNATEENRLYNV